MILVPNQMAGPLSWEPVEDLADEIGPVALFTGHPNILGLEALKRNSRSAAEHRGGRTSSAGVIELLRKHKGVVRGER